MLVALSGGPDSLALLAATVLVASESGLLCAAVVVDHGLQAESTRVAATAAEQARLLGCPDVELRVVEVPRGPGTGGPEAAARAVRYRALDDAAAGDGRRPAAAAILLGHTREDQAETVLLGLARGSGLRSIAGMPARSGRYRRPLVDLPRAVVRAAAEDEARQDPRLTPWTDPHNADPRFARARLRATVLPDLEAALGPGVTAGLARTAALARQDADALDAWADAVWEALRATGSLWICEASAAGAADTRELAQLQVAPLLAAPPAGVDEHVTEAPARPGVLPVAIQERIVRRLLLAADCAAGSLTFQHVRAVASLLHGPEQNPAVIALPGARQARREGALIRVRV